MKAGDRVMIRSQQHPWYGQTGILTDETMKPSHRGMYRVKLDNGFSAGCYLRELEKL